MLFSIVLLVLIGFVVYLGFKNDWNVASMGAGAMAILMGLIHWFGGFFSGSTPPSP